MLSGSAFNAFLKTLEEPPAHVVFILATTDPKKIPATVLSRCQRFDFKPISPESLTASLSAILDKEGVPFEPSALPLLVRASEGSLRDALSLLDTAIAYGEGKLDEASVAQLLGASSPVHVRAFVEALLARDGGSSARGHRPRRRGGRGPGGAVPRGRRGRPPAPRPEGGAISESTRLDGGRSRGAPIRGRPGERRRGDLPAPGLPRRRCGDAALTASARRARDRRGARDPPPRAADARHAPRQGRGRARPVPRGSACCRGRPGSPGRHRSGQPPCACPAHTRPGA